MLGFSKRARPVQEGGVGLLGKCPSEGDFVSLGVDTPARGTLFAWLERGVSWEREYQPGLLASLTDAPPRAFLLRSEQPEDRDRALVGLLSPSRDRVGRHFPLTLFAELTFPDTPERACVLPLAAGDFLERAYGRLAAKERIADPRELIQGLLPNIADGLPQAQLEFESFSTSTPVSVVAEALFPSAGEQWRRALWTVIEATRPFRKQEQVTTPLTLRLPVGHAGVAAVVFWLWAVRRAMDLSRSFPRAFWHVHDGGGAVVIPLGEPSPRLLSALWATNESDETLCDLTTPAPFVGALEERVESVLREDGSVGTLLGVL